MQTEIIDTFEDKSECDRMWVEYGKMLRRMGKTPRCAVRREKVRTSNGPAWRLLLVKKGNYDT